MTQLTYCACSSCHSVNRINLEKSSEARTRCAKCKSFLPFEKGVGNATTQGLSNLIAAAKMPLVVDFWAEWCGPCKMFGPIFIETAPIFFGSVCFTKVNTELEPMAGQNFGIRGIPTLVLFNNGKEVARQSGAMPKDTFVAWLKNSLR